MTAIEGTTTGGAFTGATLAEKLTKLNISQQSIETLSHWCIFHRKKAREIVETWAKKFHDAPREQRVPFLYLANDILQNSRRKGPEFVNEFWTVLPWVLRDVVDTGDTSVKKVAYRLVDIWEERRVFGSRAQGLREELLGKRPLLSANESKHFTLPSYQMFEGSMLERVARSFHAVREKTADEYGALSKYSAAMSHVETLEKEVGVIAGNASPSIQMSIADELLEQQAVIRQCVEQLEGCEVSHEMLCSHLKDALFEQENKLEQVRTHLQIAQAQLQQAGSIRHHLNSRNGSPESTVKFLSVKAPFNGFERDCEIDHLNESQVPARSKDDGRVSASPSPSGSEDMVATTNTFNEAADIHHISPKPISSAAKVAAAEVAAKLTASPSSSAMLTSALSSLAAEEASNQGPVLSPNNGSDGAFPPLEKKPRLDTNATDFSSYPLPPPKPQYLSSSGTILPFAYQSVIPPPPPPLQGRMMINQHSMGMPPQPISPGCVPAYQPFQQPYYSQPPLPAPPAPRQ
ncbi:uncharacterized protein [Physcomitrium patens]|uniref:CID domain-containing protein n=1 Tax=Physcomitrium patens TaxID=3218 RepID=A0A2K1JHN4_PHYPA|nr:regulation of nuclear pre-mRNA domain-containing protein 2-like [Physcomitrium patens]XP_024394958.1 regulation of nuclear pre-mRNA domain-containing protein 2-like [Physcomitrium patens]XP_024394959.1 regulation of nuclear pre-mRNA domain-containing protein 2-like [Physcomitrium patens]PNR41065.1 hypothetical protein PHYPA_018468 [Physcomitrium patens]|eukprot:XP_024394956.1 regulation of nuclear pre-mRNA domain-containing protein 2-like [Physcomitrella patens]